MLNDGSGFKKVYLATGFTDLRRGIDGLVSIPIKMSTFFGNSEHPFPEK